jgi:hypothetical protein
MIRKEIVKDRRFQVGTGMIIIVIILLFLLKGCESSSFLKIEDYVLKADNLILETEVEHEDLNVLLDDTNYEDLCTEPYAQQFEALGNAFISINTEFTEMEIDGNKETEIPKYSFYVRYFDNYQKMGEQLLILADTVRLGNYEEAIETITVIQTLNLATPIIE